MNLFVGFLNATMQCKTGRYAGIYTEDYAQLDDDKTASVREQYRAVLKEDANVAKALHAFPWG